MIAAEPGILQLSIDVRHVATALEGYATDLEEAQAKIDSAHDYVMYGDGRDLERVGGEVRRPNPPNVVPTEIPVYDAEDLESKRRAHVEQAQELFDEYQQKMTKYRHVARLAKEAREELDSSPLASSLQRIKDWGFPPGALVAAETKAVAAIYQKIFSEAQYKAWRTSRGAGRLSWISSRMADAPDLADLFDEIEDEYYVKALAEDVKGHQASVIVKLGHWSGHILTVAGVAIGVGLGESPGKVAASTVAGVAASESGGKAAIQIAAKWLPKAAGGAAGPIGVAVGVGAGAMAEFLVGLAFDYVSEALGGPEESVRLDEGWFLERAG